MRTVSCAKQSQSAFLHQPLLNSRTHNDNDDENDEAFIRRQFSKRLPSIENRDTGDSDQNLISGTSEVVVFRTTKSRINSEIQLLNPSPTI
ncbi:hypothetical protein BLNAU_16771 [Blattamonas nauphoetae]|uniref:Uncharacterized protein n=1 Tax=Blattamonas nauphoetae TaxID=2049346 RepID=A0ABQ9X847_9EUKA|nr:hypothetical protein BLNAU_16771 [Blattamonas nauphoetae]